MGCLAVAIAPPQLVCEAVTATNSLVTANLSRAAACKLVKGMLEKKCWWLGCVHRTIPDAKRELREEKRATR